MNITRQGDTFTVAHANGYTASVGYNTTDPAEIRAHATELRERAARLLRQAEDAEAVAAHLDSEATKQAQRDAEKRQYAAEQAKATRKHNADPWGLNAHARERKVWEAFNTIADEAERRDLAEQYVRTCDELATLCKTHNVSTTMLDACVSLFNRRGCDDASKATIRGMRKRGLIDDIGFALPLGEQIGRLAETRLSLRTSMRQDMLTEIP